MNITFVTNYLNPTSPLISLNKDKVLYILIHHVAAYRYNWQQCNHDHKARGWSCAGYNELISKDGTVYIIRGDHVGAQCTNMNSKSYGIALEGDYDRETEIPPDQFNALVARIKHNTPRFPNLIGVKQHKEFVDTSCPGKYFPFDRLIAAVNTDKLPKLRVDGKFINADIKIIDNKMYVPVRDIGEALGKKVEWDKINKIADIG